jgi:hypothetical protein
MWVWFGLVEFDFDSEGAVVVLGPGYRIPVLDLEVHLVGCWRKRGCFSEGVDFLVGAVEVLVLLVQAFLVAEVFVVF